MKQIETLLAQSGLMSQVRLLETCKHHAFILNHILAMLLQALQQACRTRRFERLRSNARFRYQASIEEVQMDASRGLDNTPMFTHATGDYLAQGQTVLISDDNGQGHNFENQKKGKGD